MKTLSVGGKLVHSDGQTNVTKLIAVFRNSVNAHKNLRARSNLLEHCGPQVPTSWICLT
jgi:hypothetical protein